MSLSLIMIQFLFHFLLLLPQINAGNSPPPAISFISASPSILPSDEPALPPDIMPAFPSPESAAGPAGMFPTIPSNPSPPNPDSLDPNSAAFPPLGYSGAAAGGSPPAMWWLVFGLGSMWWLEFYWK